MEPNGTKNTTKKKIVNSIVFYLFKYCFGSSTINLKTKNDNTDTKRSSILFYMETIVLLDR